MKKLTALFTVLLLTAGSASTVFAVSESAVLFLLISPNARAGGMGEAFVAVADDASATYWNPAGLAFQEGSQFTGMYAKWLPQFNLSDLYYINVAGRTSVEGLGTLGGSITYVSYGDQQQTLETGPDVIGTFSSFDAAFTLSYATLLSENTGVGVNIRYIRSNLAPFGAGAEQGDGKANAFAVDLGVLKKNFFIDRLNFGLNISNIGPKITYIDAAQADPLPTNFRLGFAYGAIQQEFHQLILVADMNKELVKRTEDGTDPMLKAFFSSWDTEKENLGIIYNLGAEYWYANLIALRGGFNWDKDGSAEYLTFGAGLRYSIYQFDFGYIAAGEDHPLNDTLRFSLTIGN